MKPVETVLAKILSNNNAILKSGWIITRDHLIKHDKVYSADNLESFRMVYYAAAQHLFSCVMNCLGEGTEVTEEDLAIMEGIFSEIIEIEPELERFMKLDKGKE